MNSEPVIQFINASKEYIMGDDRTFKELVPNILKGKSWVSKYKAIHNIDFTINKGEVVGIVGKNGAGKSTILKLIAGVTYPSTGEVKVLEKVAPLIELGAGFHHELSGYENIFLNAAILGMHKKEIEQCLDSIIEFSELEKFIHTPVKRYSSGMYMRLAFSIAIHVDSPILLIDEVLAVGDISFQEKCLTFLEGLKKKKDRTIIFVSHNEEAVQGFCDRAILLHQGKLIADDVPSVVFADYHHILKQ